MFCRRGVFVSSLLTFIGGNPINLEVLFRLWTLHGKITELSTGMFLSKIACEIDHYDYVWLLYNLKNLWDWGVMNNLLNWICMQPSIAPWCSWYISYIFYLATNNNNMLNTCCSENVACFLSIGWPMLYYKIMRFIQNKNSHTHTCVVSSIEMTWGYRASLWCSSSTSTLRRSYNWVIFYDIVH